MRLPTTFLVFFSTGFIATQVIAESAPTTVRYALVVGNNIGIDPSGRTPGGRLRHAEREATRVRDTLIESANFDYSTKRTRLLKSATTAELKAAFEALTLQKSATKRHSARSIAFCFSTFPGMGCRAVCCCETGRFQMTKSSSFSRHSMPLFRCPYSIPVFPVVSIGAFFPRAFG